MGGLVAQEVTLARPELVRRLVLVGTGPRGGEGLGALPAWVAELFTRKYEQQQDMWLPIMFAPTETSQAAGRAHVERIVARADRDAPVSEQSITAQRAALAAYGAARDPSYAHLKGLDLPVLVVNGTQDIIIPTINSYILQQFLPNAELILYPYAATARISNIPDCSPVTRASSSTTNPPPDGSHEPGHAAGRPSDRTGRPRTGLGQPALTPPMRRNGPGRSHSRACRRQIRRRHQEGACDEGHRHR